MSIQAVGWAIGRPIEDATAKLVLIVLANYADHETGRCWPTIERIAREASQSERSVQRKLRALADDGFIRITPSEEMSGRQRANSYWLEIRPHEVSAGSSAGEGDNLTPLAAKVAISPEIAGNTLENRENCASDASNLRGDSLSPRGDTAVTGEGDTAVTPYKKPSDTTISFPQSPLAGVSEDRLHSGKSRNPDPEGFAKFERLYPFDALMNRVKAAEVWAGLTVRDREAALRYAARYAEACRLRPNKLKDAHRWLAGHGWDSLAQHEKREAEKMGLKNPMVFVHEGSRAWIAWVASLAAKGRDMGPAHYSKWYRGRGRLMPTLFPPVAGTDGEKLETDYDDYGDRGTGCIEEGLRHDRQ